MPNNVQVRRLLLALLVLCPVIIGCADRGPESMPKYAVKGTVKIDGKLLDKGTIHFESDPPDGLAASADVVNGSYSLQATAGKKIVRINRVEEKEIDMGGEKMKVAEETLAAKYNAESKLTREVKADQENVLDFDLE